MGARERIVRGIVLGALLWGALLQGIAAEGAERIVRFASTIQIRADGVVSVREEITVTVEHHAIRHGIFRDFPTIHRTAEGEALPVGFRVRDARLDGEAVPHTTETLSGQGIRIRIGDADRDAPLGSHTYTLAYDTWGQVGFFQDFDEIYWNVTGHDWAFPIDEAHAVVLLPEGAPTLRTAFYTGPAGARGKGAAERRGTGRAAFETTAPLGAAEGLTVAVAFPKGWVVSGDLVSALARRAAFLHGLRHPAVPLGLFLLVALFVFAVWLRYGRDRPRGIIIPLFDPPDRVDPALASFLHRQGDIAPEAFPAAVVGLAVKGALRIEDRTDDTAVSDRIRAWMGSRRFVLVRTDPDPAAPALSKTECGLRDVLFHRRSEVPLNPEDEDLRSHLSHTLSWFRTTLRKNGAKFVSSHGGWSLGGAVFALALFGTLGVLLSIDEDMVPPVLLLLGWNTVGGGLFCAALRRSLLQRGAPALRGCRGVFRALAGWSVVGALALALAMGFLALGMILSFPFALGYAGTHVINLIFFRLLRNFTPTGRLVADRVEGFRMYLGTAERERLRILAGDDLPEDTPAQFERLLPYALALGVEQTWATRFASVLAGTSYAPTWYRGHDDFSGGPLFTESFSSFSADFGSTLSDASAPPGSSSGSDGGGCSGGGGGGGGGGGW